mmetsp:Transcript_31325/g.78496  ORF Transcript_31325/g.78496 Transcript_31325/m.78496 type:complete len:356 (-) Transcript_31325:3704-4771(-)
MLNYLDGARVCARTQAWARGKGAQADRRRVVPQHHGAVDDLLEEAVLSRMAELHRKIPARIEDIPNRVGAVYVVCGIHGGNEAILRELRPERIASEDLPVLEFIPGLNCERALFSGHRQTQAAAKRHALAGVHCRCEHLQWERLRGGVVESRGLLHGLLRHCHRQRVAPRHCQPVLAAVGAVPKVHECALVQEPKRDDELLPPGSALVEKRVIRGDAKHLRLARHRHEARRRRGARGVSDGPVHVRDDRLRAGGGARRHHQGIEGGCDALAIQRPREICPCTPHEHRVVARELYRVSANVPIGPGVERHRAQHPPLVLLVGERHRECVPGHVEGVAEDVVGEDGERRGLARAHLL